MAHALRAMTAYERSKFSTFIRTWDDANDLWDALDALHVHLSADPLVRAAEIDDLARQEV